jgi:hypothetical protein
MKSENTIVKIGDVVKSLDFVGHNNCYYVGVVTAIQNDGTFCADTIKRVWMGQIDTDFVSNSFVAPLPGNFVLDDEFTAHPRIQVLA